MPRPSEASCAICMDSLFNAKDDLNDVLAVTAPDCGHVFHESCLSNWFDQQAKAYLARTREQGLVRTKADAPAECPSCRAEVFLDAETGKLALHRLYVNFGEAMSSQAMSSPIARPGPSTQRRQEATVPAADLAMFRRAKGIAAAVDVLGPNSSEEDVRGVLGSVAGFEGAVRGDSAQVSAMMKKYLGGLIVAVNKLREQIQTHPLIPELEEENAKLREANDLQINHLTHLEAVRIPAEVKKAVDKAVRDERIKMEREIRRVAKEGELIRGELEKERVGRTRFRQAMREREEQLEAELSHVEAKLKKEQAERAAVEVLLVDRTRLVKMHQQKAEKRKPLQLLVEQLKRDNDRLRTEAAMSFSKSQPQPPASQVPDVRTEDAADEFDYGDLEFDLDDIDLPEPTVVSSGARKHSAPDNSLIVDMPPLDLSFDAGPSNVRSTTARTFTFDVDEGRVKNSDKGKGKSKESKFAEYRRRRSESSRPKEKSPKPTKSLSRENSETTRSKYFAHPFQNPARSPSPAPERLYDILNDVLVSASSPPGSPSPSKKARYSPMSSVDPDSYSRANAGDVFKPPRKPAAKPPRERERPPEDEVIDLVSSSPPPNAQLPARPVPAQRVARDGLRRGHSLNFGSGSGSGSGAGSGSGSGTGVGSGAGSRSSATARAQPLFPTHAASRTQSMLDFLGVADGKGRVKKGVALGSKQRRKA